MEYLVMLLDIYEEEVLMTHHIGDKIKGKDAVYLISKEFGFIERLVENDKIDLKEFHKLCGIINQDSEYWNGTPQDYEQVIMYLSISDYPIEDLISILKE